MPKKKQKIKDYQQKTLVLGILVALIVTIIAFFSVISWGLYQLDWQGSFVYNVTRIIPYPAARVNQTSIRYDEYLQSLYTARQFYQRQIESGIEIIPDDQEIKEFVIERLVDNIIVEKISKQYNISVSQEELDNKINEIIKNQGSEAEFQNFLKQYYNLSIDEYVKIFTLPDLYFAKASQVVVNDESLNIDGLTKIQAALSELDGGKSFESVAKEYSQGETALSGGYIGEVYRGDLPSQIEDELYSMEPGQYTDVLSMPGSLQIIKLDKKDLDEGKINVSAIIIPVTTLDDLILQEKETLDVKIYVY